MESVVIAANEVFEDRLIGNSSPIPLDGRVRHLPQELADQESMRDPRLVAMKIASMSSVNGSQKVENHDEQKEKEDGDIGVTLSVENPIPKLNPINYFSKYPMIIGQDGIIAGFRFLDPKITNYSVGSGNGAVEAYVELKLGIKCICINPESYGGGPILKKPEYKFLADVQLKNMQT